ncbi:3,4-dihydroxy-2-butanone 4-phosphate synthase [Candidatus Nitrosotalea sp. TS]|uniref:3,4-dihydroxy-2-butanone-4-phosphate synthase n=1 Tax=Candidatus Nitrosotalea sp. TS TaxID=2341020 RepID=UPI001407F761|nr:3,4-dihydroxy-2-butanone-4-phosphate synthase [Candidatus Nitrosotalea sp. TS]MDE1826587.1 3,4-dihydroxy-2-butanone-4-phosphate synthase [Nitrososphaerota archaeon]NHI04223.1 3,4-dihydroxy-2-butanone 4-phosphate synthase [Candidatus Nitrosotalea sp. TS]
MSLEETITSLKRGDFVLLHDGNTRENEVDMVVAADFVTPEHVARMRQDAGGLICLSLNHAFAKNLGLNYMHDILSNSQNVDAESKKMIIGKAPYGDRPSFSISINHQSTYTGVTDRDRALTMSEMARLYKNPNENKKEIFNSSFKTPGHVSVLIASEGLLSSRLGHTEMSVYLATLAGLSPVTVICEMLDSETYGALSAEKAKKYAKQNAIPYFDGSKLVEYAKEH